jgi:hypothetical protein
MISDPTDMQKYLIFKALARAIEQNWGMGFLNADQGHPAYVSGAKGDNSETWGDSPARNEFFKLLESFDDRFHKEGPDLSTWQKFCAFAVGAYNVAKGRG